MPIGAPEQQYGGVIEPELSTPLDGYRSCQATSQESLKNGTLTIAPEVLSRTERAHSWRDHIGWYYV